MLNAYTRSMTEDEARIALHRIYLKYQPEQSEAEWGHHHMEAIRRLGKGYWMKPAAETYVGQVERGFIKS